MAISRFELSLNGAWDLVLDPHDEGKKCKWCDGSCEAQAIPVQVPSVWDVWVPDYDGVGWYFRRFAVGDEWRERSVWLHFEAADYHAEVWLNGHRLGEHEGGYTPFSFDATEHIRIGEGEENLLAVRIVDPHGPEGYGDFKPKQIPCAKEEGYFSFAGLWGAVTIEGRHAAHIVDVFVQPDIRRKRITVDVTTSQPGEVRLSIAGTSYTTTGSPENLVLDFPEHELWSPENPVLYVLRCELLLNGECVDEVSVRFGMREFTVKDQRFYLNTRPILIKGVLHQPDYARSLAAPESAELARRELELAKQAGFNLIRLHIKTAPRITLELADEIGLLLYEEPPIGWIKDSEWMRERCEREVREMILRDRNHPSIVMWGMLNESGNADYVVNGGAQRIKDDLCLLARTLDPSRLIIDDSGGVNTTREPARFIRPYREEFEAYDDLHIYQRAPVDHEIEHYYRHSGDPERLCFISEFGFGGMEDLADVLVQYGSGADTLKDACFVRKMLEAARQGYAERNLDRVFGDFGAFTAAARELQCDAARHQIDAMRVNGKVGGYCYTQLCDAGHEFCAGVLDRWRRPKPVFKTLKEVQSALRPVIHAAHTNLTPRQQVKVSVVLLNDERIEGYVDLSLQLVGPTNQVFWKKKRSTKLQRTGKEIWVGSVSASGSTGMHRFVVRLMKGMKLLAENSLDLHVYERPDPAPVEVHVLDPRDEWRDAIFALAKPGRPEAPVHIIPPLGNTIRAYPDSGLAHVFAQVKGGAVALVFGPPDDWNDLAERIAPELRATNKDAVGAFLGMYHYAKLHPVFDGLPARAFMRQTYANIVPPKTFVETSDEDICGTFDTTPIATGNYMLGETSWWGSDILVRRYGAGRLVFTYLRVLENLGADPVADRLFVNMLNHFSRRSVPSEEALPLAQEAIDWLQRERNERTRLWMVIGMFPNWGDQGHDKAYPPETQVDFGATYPGWYKPVEWKRWCARADDNYAVNLQEAFTPAYEYYPRFDYGTGYAYAEFNCNRRQNVRLKLALQDAAKVWLNGALVHESQEHLAYKTTKMHLIEALVRQGRNTILVKVSKLPGEFQFGLDIESATKDPLNLRWWK